VAIQGNNALGGLRRGRQRRDQHQITRHDRGERASASKRRTALRAEATPWICAYGAKPSPIFGTWYLLARGR
jgi:hypothetical protein